MNRFFFAVHLFGKERTVAEPWASIEELFEIYKKGREKIEKIISKNSQSR